MISRLQCSILLAFLLVGGWWAWLGSPQEQIVIEILAPGEIEHTKPVYAQFVFSQNLTIPQLIHASALVIPLYVPDPRHPLNVTVRRNDAEVMRWQYQADEAGMVVAHLPFTSPPLLDGKIIVELSAPDIAAAQQAEAPHVFIETADYAYPDGNYSIANNQKQGDIALTLLGQTSRWQLFKQGWSRAPLGQASKVGYALLASLLIVLSPYALAFKRSPNVGT